MSFSYALANFFFILGQVSSAWRRPTNWGHKQKYSMWGHEMTDEQKVPTFQFEKLINYEEEVYKWLVTLAAKTGLAKVENTPKALGQVIKLGERVGYVVQTCYGLVSNSKLFELYSFLISYRLLQSIETIEMNLL